MTPKQEAALRQALEALEVATTPLAKDRQEVLRARAAIREALAEQPAQEPVSDALHFAQWTAAKKDLSDYILVGSLSLAGIEDGEYGTSEIDPLDNTIEALQEKLVTGPDHKKVPLLAYIGALNNTSPQPAQQKPTCKQNLQVWVISNGKGRGQFSWEPQDERYWTRMEPAQQQSAERVEPLTDEQRRETINRAWNEYLRGEGHDSFGWYLSQATEAAHGIKE